MSSTNENRRSWWQRLGSLHFAVAVLVACNALYILLVAIGNIFDYETNFAFVQHVLSMDTTNFGGDPGTGLDPDVMWRAVTVPWMWHVGYIGIIVWESLAAVILIAGVVAWIRAFATGGSFASARASSSIGLVMIMLLFFGGFIAGGGEWFNMWRSTSWNGLDAAFRNATLAGITLLLLHLTTMARPRRVPDVEE